MRYRGQSFEIETPLERDWILHGDIDAISNAFHQEHERMFGYKDAETKVMVINLRLVISSPSPKPTLPVLAPGKGNPKADAHVTAYLDGQLREVPFYARKNLLAGHSFEGPAIVAQDDCTTCVPPGMNVAVDPFGNLVITPRNS
jgi:N-methylhydantoinase A